MWVGDYTIQPENGGLGVFAHEFAHDLGLPDLYDTSGNTGGAENTTAFWTLMSLRRQHRRRQPRRHRRRTDRPRRVGAVPARLARRPGRQRPVLRRRVQPGEKRRHARPEHAGHQAAAGGVRGPARQGRAARHRRPPACGSKIFYSGAGNDLNDTMTHTRSPLRRRGTAKVRYEIEKDCDYAFLEASSNGGATWTPVATNLSHHRGRPERIQHQRCRASRASAGAWVDLTATVPAGTNAIRFRY